MDKDLFEEFEFKPLTDGLGFNKKAQPMQTPATNLSAPSSMKTISLDDDDLLNSTPATVKKKFDDVLATLEKSPLPKATSSLEFVGALPRDPKEKTTAASITSAPLQSSGMAMPTISPFPSMDVYKKMDSVAATAGTAAVTAPAIGVRRGGHDSMAPGLEPVSVSFTSAVLDLIVVFAVFLVFLSTLLLITNVDLSSVMMQVETNTATKISMAVLFLTVLQIYVVLSRSLFGQTLGEWTFDMQMGKKEDQKSETYPLRVLGRSLLMLVTGIVVLPLISLISNQDIAARITGIQLYRQRI